MKDLYASLTLFANGKYRNSASSRIPAQDVPEVTKAIALLSNYFDLSINFSYPSEARRKEIEEADDWNRLFHRQ